MIQSIITWLIVAASVGIVIRSILKGIRGKEGCSCYFCGDNSCGLSKLGNMFNDHTKEVICEDKG